MRAVDLCQDQGGIIVSWCFGGVEAQVKVPRS